MNDLVIKARIISIHHTLNEVTDEYEQTKVLLRILNINFYTRLKFYRKLYTLKKQVRKIKDLLQQFP